MVHITIITQGLIGHALAAVQGCHTCHRPFLRAGAVLAWRAWSWGAMIERRGKDCLSIIAPQLPKYLETYS
jgi:hypothetical protein